MKKALILLSVLLLLLLAACEKEARELISAFPLYPAGAFED